MPPRQPSSSPTRSTPTASLALTLHEVYLALAKTPIEGPGGVEATFDFRPAYNAEATRMLTIALENQQAAAEYA